MNRLSVGARTPVTPGPVNPFSEIASSWQRSLESFFFIWRVCEHEWNGMISKCGFSLPEQNRAVVYQITGGNLQGILGGGCAARFSKSDQKMSFSSPVFRPGL